MHAQYEVGSITKEFTAAAILQLSEAGKLSLDAPVATYLPDAPHAREVTIRQLLAHTSGLAEYMPANDADLAKPTTFESEMRAVAARPLAFAPGTTFAHSNTNYLILGRIVEVVSGQSWDTYAKTHLFVPAGLTETTTLLHERLPQARRIDETWATATGDIVTTASDLVKWAAALASGRIISANDYHAFTQPQQLSDGSFIEYGLGQYFDTLDDQPRTLAQGDTLGFDATDEYFANQQLRIIVLLGAEGGPRGVSQSEQLADRLFEDAVPGVAAKTAVRDDAHAHALYVAAIDAMSGLTQPAFVTYHMIGTSDGLPMSFSIQGGNLWLNIGSGSTHTSWTIEHRTFDYRSNLVDDANKKEYTTARSFFDPTWYGTERALRLGMLNTQDPAPPKNATPSPAPPIGPTLRTIAVTSVMSPSLFNIEDRGPTACANGDPARALHLWSRALNRMHQISDVAIDLRSHRFCMMRYSIADTFGFHGVVQQNFSDVGGYWMQTDGFLDGTLRFMGISGHHGIWRYALTDMQFPPALDLPAVVNKP